MTPVGDDANKRLGSVPLSRRLSIRLFAITAVAVMLAEILIFVPSIASFRWEWLHNKIETVSVASLAAELGESKQIPTPDEERELLHALDASLIAIRGPNATRLLARLPEIGPVDLQVDLNTETPAQAVIAAFEMLIAGGGRSMRLVGSIGDGSMTGETVVADEPLRKAMLAYSRNIFFLSLGIASFTGLLVFTAINVLLLAPVRRMTNAMVRFGSNPEDPSRVIRPSLRQDELGLAERELEAMQATLARTLREQRHLANLGLAVSKINHDLRNILASAQLISDRLSDLPDAQVQRFAPTLIRSLDRALHYTQSVLSYGRASESRPTLRRIDLHLLVDEIFQGQPVSPERETTFVNAVPEGFEVDVDPDQMFRALSNLVRNAVQALEGDESEAVIRRITVTASADDEGRAEIAVDDTGPGLSEGARANLFTAFRGSTRAGGVGLGLAIAQEIVQAHGGEIRLAERAGSGTRFEIDLPSAFLPSPRPPHPAVPKAS